MNIQRVFEAPFHDNIKNFANNNPEFTKSLKLTEDKRFHRLDVVFISSIPEIPEDQVVGVFCVDSVEVKSWKKCKHERPIIKQDFIVMHTDGSCTSYTRNKKVPQSKHVKDINEFFKRYGKGKYYGTDRGKKYWDHHIYKLEQLTEYHRSEAERVIDTL